MLSPNAEPFKIWLANLGRQEVDNIFDPSKGIDKNHEYAILTNGIYKSWSGMKANEYKAYKGIRKESLRINMTDIEVVLTDLEEIATRELAKEYKPNGLHKIKKLHD